MNILEYCKSKGITIAEFSRKLDRHPNTLTRIANGQRATTQDLYDKIHQIAPEIEFIKIKSKNNHISYKIKNPNDYLKRKFKKGDKVGYLTLIEDTGKRNDNGNVYWKCKCICGKELIRGTASFLSSFRSNSIISCGCKKPLSDIGIRELHNPIRIEKARKEQGIVEGTMLCNLQRKNLNKNNTSGVRGVHWKSREQKWCGGIEFKRKTYKKLFDTKEEAIIYRKYLEDKFFKPILNKYGRQLVNNKELIVGKDS